MLCRAMNLTVLAVLFVMLHGINPLPRIASMAGEPAGHQDILQRLVCHASDKWVRLYLSISARWTRAIDLRDALGARHMSVVAGVYRPLSRVVQAHGALEHIQDGGTRFFLVILGAVSDFWMISLHFSTFCRTSAHGGADAISLLTPLLLSWNWCPKRPKPVRANARQHGIFSDLLCRVFSREILHFPKCVN